MHEPNSGPILAVYYDSWCPLCQKARRRLIRLDWRGRLHFRSIREPGVVDESGLPAQQLEARMHSRHLATGQIAAGIGAVAAVTAQIPVLMPLWPFIKAAQWLGLGQPLYDFIARRRALLPAGACREEHCRVHGGR